MATRPAVAGLVKHQLMISQGALETGVTTIWTWKNADPPAEARITAERAQIVAWVSSHWKTGVGTGVSADRLKTWNFGVSPPAKYSDQLIFPRVFGTNGNTVMYGFSAVVALRSQAVGSAIRNRLNGRIYHPPGANSCTFPEGVINGSGQVLIRDIYNNLRDRLDPGTVADVGDWVVPSFWSGGALRPVPVMIAVDHCLVGTQPGFQESRMGNQPAYTRGT